MTLLALPCLPKTEIDRTTIDLYNKFRTHAPTVTSMPTAPTARRDYDDIRSFFNICELIPVGIKKRAFSKSVSYAYWGDIIPNSYQTAKQLIDCIRNTPGQGSAATYVDLEKLAQKWAAKTAGGQVKTALVAIGCGNRPALLGSGEQIFGAE
jgi:Domain of unknown function (DUF4760)